MMRFRGGSLLTETKRFRYLGSNITILRFDEPGWDPREEVKSKKSVKNKIGD